MFAIASGTAQSSTLGVVQGDAGSNSGALDEFIQWRSGGANLGDRKVRVIDFVDPSGQKMIVTRGVGENRHVITVRSLQQVLIFTSWPYPVEEIEPVDIGLAVPVGGWLLGAFVDTTDLALAIPVGGQLLSVLQQYTLQLPEKTDLGLAVPVSGLLPSVLQSYTFQPAEASNLGLAIPLSGSVPVVLVSYTNQLPESANLGLAIPISGTLT